MEDIRIRVGLNVAALRRERRLSQEALAALADMNQTYLSEIENGKRNPTIVVLARIAAALGEDVERLVRPRLAGAQFPPMPTADH